MPARKKNSSKGKERKWSPAQLAVREKFFTPRKLEAQKARKAGRKTGKRGA